MSHPASLIHAALGPLVAGRCYPNAFPQPAAGGPPTWPAIRFQLISAAPAPDLCGDDGIDTAAMRFQIDVVDQGYDASVALAQQVIEAMAGLATPAVLDSYEELPDAETATHRVRLDYLLHPSSEIAS